MRQSDHLRGTIYARLQLLDTRRIRAIYDVRIVARAVAVSEKRWKERARRYVLDRYIGQWPAAKILELSFGPITQPWRPPTPFQILYDLDYRMDF